MSKRDDKQLLLDILESIGKIQTYTAACTSYCRDRECSPDNALLAEIGKRVNEELLKGERADYGAQDVLALSEHLVLAYGSGFSEKSLRRMIQFATLFPAEPIVATLSRQLGWSHFKEILFSNSP